MITPSQESRKNGDIKIVIPVLNVCYKHRKPPYVAQPAKLEPSDDEK